LRLQQLKIITEPRCVEKEKGGEERRREARGGPTQERGERGEDN